MLSGRMYSSHPRDWRTDVETEEEDGLARRDVGADGRRYDGE
jgi:hypothetical protein